MLGSFPPKEDKWSMRFFYPNWINDMWRIMGYIFYNDKEYFIVEENGKKQYRPLDRQNCIPADRYRSDWFQRTGSYWWCCHTGCGPHPAILPAVILRFPVRWAVGL